MKNTALLSTTLLSNQRGEQENLPEDFLNKPLGRQEENGKKKNLTEAKKRMSFPKVWAHLCSSRRQPYWWGEEGKVHTAAGA